MGEGPVTHPHGTPVDAVQLRVVIALVDGSPDEVEGALASGGALLSLVAALVIYAAPITMAALNPARDLGPRIYAKSRDSIRRG